MKGGRAAPCPGPPRSAAACGRPRASAPAWGSRRLPALPCSPPSRPREHCPFSPGSWSGCPGCRQATTQGRLREHCGERRLRHQRMGRPTDRTRDRLPDVETRTQRPCSPRPGSAAAGPGSPFAPGVPALIPFASESSFLRLSPRPLRPSSLLTLPPGHVVKYHVNLAPGSFQINAIIL